MIRQEDYEGQTFHLLPDEDRINKVKKYFVLWQRESVHEIINSDFIVFSVRYRETIIIAATTIYIYRYMIMITPKISTKNMIRTR